VPRIDFYYLPNDAFGRFLWAFAIAAILLLLWRPAGPWIALAAASTVVFGFGIDHHLYIGYGVLLCAVIYRLVHRGAAMRLALPTVVWQLSLLGAGYFLYEAGRKRTEGNWESAQSNSLGVLDLERRLKLNFEPDLQNWVIQSDRLVHWFSRFYSSFYLPFVIAGILWFLLTDRQAYLVLRNALGISALISLFTFWQFPVAPPRLIPEANVIDMHDLVGRYHAFVNEYAAVPSLHVGWMMLVGYMLWRSLRPNWYSAVAWLPGTLMFVTVMVTGNHYWFDGLVGMMYTLVPAVILLHWTDMRRWWTRWLALPEPAKRPSMAQAVQQQPWAMFSVTSLGFLLMVLVVGQIVDPGFTDYWGYMIAQFLGTILLIGWFSQRFAPEGGLSAVTHLAIVAVTYADTLGTAADFYKNYVFYDKITHFGGGAIIAAVGYDIVTVLNLRGALRASAFWRVVIAVTVSMIVCSLWELYELVGDTLFDTGRNGGELDTLYDLISDFSGALVAAIAIALLAPFFKNVHFPSPATGERATVDRRLGEQQGEHARIASGSD
jgi:hypothetical protein